MNELNRNTSLPEGELKEFWEAGSRGKLLIKHCTNCNEPHFYPRTLCPFCFSPKTEWQEASGRGRIYSFSIESGEAPRVIAYVTLAEGPTILTNIVDSELAEIAIGREVSLVYKPGPEGLPLAMFELVA